MQMRSVRAVSVASVLMAASAAIAHPYGWRVGQTIDGDLTVDFLWGMSHHLNDSIPGLPGIADRDLGFEEFPVDNPPMNLYTLDPGGKIELVIDGFDDALFLRDDKDPMTGLHDPGGSLAIGSSGTGFLTRPWWHLDTTHPDYTYQGLWSASFHLRDSNGIHGDSETYTFTMRVPAPGTAAVLGSMGVMACRRRR